MVGRRSVRAGLWAGCLALAAGPACVTGERTNELCDPQNRAEGAQPALLIDLVWDTQSSETQFVGGDCELAGVDSMHWELVDRDGESYTSGEGGCTDTIDLCDLPAGDYVLQIEGMDPDGEVRWASQCEDLQLVRFDTLYRCDVPQP